jgi:hypothetical protein
MRLFSIATSERCFSNSLKRVSTTRIARLPTDTETVTREKGAV